VCRPAPAAATTYVGSFETKYHYNYRRPVTAIRAADTDGNSNTSTDPRWTALVTTPPIPDYDSAHAVQGGAADEVSKRFFETDHIGRNLAHSRRLPLPQGDGGGDRARPQDRRSFRRRLPAAGALSARASGRQAVTRSR